MQNRPLKGYFRGKLCFTIKVPHVVKNIDILKKGNFVKFPITMYSVPHVTQQHLLFLLSHVVPTSTMTKHTNS